MTEDPALDAPAEKPRVLAGYAPLILAPAPAVMLPLVVASGLLLPPLLAATFLTVDRIAPAGTAAEAFAWVATAFTSGAAVGAALDGAILDRTPGVGIGFVLAPGTIA